MDTHFFDPQHWTEARLLLESLPTLPLSFSEGTYQAEVKDKSKKKIYWPFLQLNDEGSILDCFCSCRSEKGSCVHLAAAYQRIFNLCDTPLHVRFRSSLWNQLCLMACQRLGWESTCLKKEGSGYTAYSSTGKKLYSVEALDPVSKKKLKALLFERKIETEETSLKFSNLPPEELALWKAGHPSAPLRYELCFWSDIAKWLMALQENQQKYQIKILEKKGELPHWIQIRFASLSMGFYVSEAHWPSLIPSLESVHSPLSVHTFGRYKLKAIRYDEERCSLRIEKEPLQGGATPLLGEALPQGIEVGEWIYQPHQGFFPKTLDRVFECDEIPREKIGSVLSQYAAVLQRHLTAVPLHLQDIPARYEIFFDQSEDLHVVCYAFEKGDLQKEGSAYFGPWIYLRGKGFYRLAEALFPGIERRIKRSEMNDFVNRHRAWLGGFEGFQTHVYRFESHLHFTVSKESELQFQAQVDLLDQTEGTIDFGEWIYIRGKGFFAKMIGKGGGLIDPTTKIPKNQVAAFIRAHREELETIPGFFASNSPLEKSGLDVFINADERIVVRPHFKWGASYEGRPVLIFEEYTYVASEGFFEIPCECRVPEAYLEEKVIPEGEEPYFVLYELETLKPCLLSLQTELKKPQHLSLRIQHLEKNRRTHAVEWLLDAVFETDLGSLDLFAVWKALQENKRYLFSSAGCLLLKQPRFNWLKGITKRQWLKKGKQLRLTTLQWLRLSAFEALKSSQDVSDPLFLMQQAAEFPLDLSGLTSSLRPYQETGVHWLWFLAMHGLSGLLCDEMGLGKTHQAMGLIAALDNQKKEPGAPASQTLVVCPTSVVYHWQALLKRFLPQSAVSVFYGASRSLDSIIEKGGVLLTSYGTLRSDIDALSQLEFRLAIFDELQIAKNNRSQTHKSLKKIRAQMRLGLSGTPIENRLLELKALFDVIVPGYLPTEALFRELFIVPIEKYQDAEKKSLLSRLIRPFILRRKKAEVLLELPEKIEEIAYCELSDEQKTLYHQTYALHKEALIHELENPQQPVPYLHIFSLLSTLKQICNHPCLISKEYAHFQKHQSGKWDLLVELLQEIRDSGQKVVIFSQYLDMLDLIQIYLKEQRIGFAGIRGSTRDRKEQLERFREDSKCEVFLASLQAAGVGIDLTSASVVIHYDRWWNPAKENQATDRVHRIGQNRGVQVFKMVSKGTIEEHIHTLIEKKKALMDSVLGFDDQDLVKRFNREELLELLRLIDPS